MLVASFDDDVQAFLLVPPDPAEFALLNFAGYAEQVASGANRAMTCGSVSYRFHHVLSPPPRNGVRSYPVYQVMNIFSTGSCYQGFPVIRRGIRTPHTSHIDTPLRDRGGSNGRGRARIGSAKFHGGICCTATPPNCH